MRTFVDVIGHRKCPDFFKRKSSIPRQSAMFGCNLACPVGKAPWVDRQGPSRTSYRPGIRGDRLQAIPTSGRCTPTHRPLPDHAAYSLTDAVIDSSVAKGACQSNAGGDLVGERRGTRQGALAKEASQGQRAVCLTRAPKVVGDGQRNCPLSARIAMRPGAHASPRDSSRKEYIENVRACKGALVPASRGCRNAAWGRLSRSFSSKTAPDCRVVGPGHCC